MADSGLRANAALKWSAACWSIPSSAEMAPRSPSTLISPARQPARRAMARLLVK
jgi:hypothetical protein